MDISKSRLLWAIEILALIAVIEFCRYFGVHDKSPIIFCIFYLFVAINMLWPWRSDKTELLKRCFIATPFAILSAIVVKILAVETVPSIYIGMALFLWLIIKTNNWKMHFAITFTVTIISICLLLYLGHGAYNKYKLYIIPGIAIPLLTFYMAYLNDITSKELMDFRQLFMKSIKFAIALLLTFYSLLLSDQLCEHYHVSFAISFGISILIALGFLGFCKLFNIKHPVASDASENITNAKLVGECECCGKMGIPQELLFKIDSKQRVCAGCLVKMERR